MISGMCMGADPYKNNIFAGSLEVAREMLMPVRDDRIANLVDNAFLKGEIESLRLTLIEQLGNLSLAYRGSINDDINNILLIVLQCTINFLNLLSGANSPWSEIPRHTVK